MKRRRFGERGETLLELLITITLMGGVIVAVLAGIAVASNSSDEQKKDVGVEVVLRDYAEAVIGAPYNGCAVPTAINYTAPPKFAVAAAATGCYDGASSSGGYGGSADKGAVRIRLTVTTTDVAGPRQRSRSLEVVKAADYVRPS